MSTDITLRPAMPADFDALGEVMFDAIHHGPTKYTEAQSKAWAPQPRRGEDWAGRLAPQHIVVAERSAELLGFMSIEASGYIDFAYIRPRAQGSGLFRKLYAEIETWAKTNRVASLSTHASLMAQPAFAAMGFTIDFHETVDANGQSLARARMVKTL